MRLIIRLDDIAPTMDWAKFGRARAIFEKYNIKPLIGVVPENKDSTLDYSTGEADVPDFWATIHELVAAGWSVAQHGTYHVYETEDAGLLGINPFSEFAGLDYEKQYEKLKAGRDILLAHGIHTDIFMAPGHTYDRDTIKALKELGFTTITDGLYTECYDLDGIVCVPCRLAAWDKIQGLDTMCLHTNLMDEEDMDELERFVAAHKDEIIEFDTVEFAEAAVPYSVDIRRGEEKVLERRRQKDRVANNARLAWYLSYTNHKNSKVKWLKRVIMLPLLLTNKYKNNEP